MIQKSMRMLYLPLAIGLLLSGSSFGAKKPATIAPQKKTTETSTVSNVIPKKDFIEALKKLAKDERVPVASSTLVEKGRGEEYYSVEKAFDGDPETFWAEGAKESGRNEWIVFHIPDESTHIEIVPGAGKEQFQNFNRPKTARVDIYLIKLKQEDGDYLPTFKLLSQVDFSFKDTNTPVQRKIPVKLPELAIEARTLYVGVLILQNVYRGQFDDTSIAEIRVSAIWGEK
jgi:hypothetical protein